MNIVSSSESEADAAQHIRFILFLRKLFTLIQYLALLGFLIMIMDSARASEPCTPVVAHMASAQGVVEMQRSTGTTWQTARLNEVLCQGDSVRTGQNSRAAVSLVNEAVLRLDQNSSLRLTDIVTAPKKKSVFDLIKGALESFSRKPRHFSINTPYLNGSIEGTEFAFRVEDNRTTLTVFEGVVVAENDQGKVRVLPGNAAVAEKGQAPQLRTVVRPRDAAQWSLYYPPVLSLGTSSAPTFESLAKVPENERDASFYLKRAAFLLSVGQVDEARAAIDNALTKDSKAGLAYALRAVIKVVQNDRTAALADAKKAVELSPDSSAAKIALSYAQQSQFDIKGARDTMMAATAQQPKDALAWSRLAELELMLDNRTQALADANKATALEPQLGQTQTTLGFAALADFKSKQARAAFQKAITVNSADPLPHFGLGLSEISLGDLKKGTGEIEVAVGLDSTNALLRAYLGKAYFSEKRAPLDAEQFGIAKDLDPHDPTAYLYDGIRKQTENDPVGALHDIEDSIARNDNRATYRSRLLLDKDHAARGTSLARVYSDLGLTQLGVNEATQSLALDPANASAHRFLSDSYQDVRRRGIARVSNLMQAQLLQSINLNPIQPSLNQANLNIVTMGGPASAGFNEFTPLFEQNQARADVAVFGGNNGTRSGETVLSGLYGRYSLSAGAFTYWTDGWRPHNEFSQHIQNVFAQAAVTDRLNVQAEYQHQRSSEGDLAFNFNYDPARDFTNTNPDYTDVQDYSIERKEITKRLGLRFTPETDSTVLLSYVNYNYSEEFNNVTLTTTTVPGVGTFLYDNLDTSRNRQKGNQTEAQYILERHRSNFIVGAAVNNSSFLDAPNIIYSFIVPPNFVLPQAVSSQNMKVRDPRGYIYANIKAPVSVTWTLGLNYDDYQQGSLEVKRYNPKLGVQWDITSNLRLRAAAFQVIKPVLGNNRTLEPTQVAGFNQLFDDYNGTEYKRYALGADWKPSHTVAAGLEITGRKLDQPIVNYSTWNWTIEKRDEMWHRLYLYWTPHERVAVRSELTYDYNNMRPGAFTGSGYPEYVRTVSLPVGIRYFAPSSGWFGGATGTAVRQSVGHDAGTGPTGRSTFFVVDASVGYRLGQRCGLLSLGVMNLLDRKFNYQDDSYREFSTQPVIGPYFPARTVLARLVLNF